MKRPSFTVGPLFDKLRLMTAVYSHLPTPVYWLVFVRLLVTTGNFVYPMVTLFLTQKLKLQGDTTGFVLLLMTIATFGGTVVGGLLADLRSRKLVIAGSLLLSGAAYLLVLVCDKPLPIIALIVASMAIYSGSEPATSALIADHTPEERRADAFSLSYLALSTAYCIAPMAAGFLFEKWPNVLFAIDGSVTVAGGVIIYFFLGDVPSSSAERREAPRAEARLDLAFLKGLFSNPAVLLFSGVYMMHTLIYSQTTFALPLFLHHIAPLAGVSEFGIVMAVNSAAVLVLTPLLARITRSMAPLAKCAIAGLCFALGFGGYFFVSSFVFVLLGTVVWSAGEVLSFTSARVYVANRSRDEDRGRMNMVLELMHDAGYGVGPLVVGLLVVRAPIRSVWLFLFFCGVLSALLFWLLHKRQATHLKHVNDDEHPQSGESTPNSDRAALR